MQFFIIVYSYMDVLSKKGFIMIIDFTIKNFLSFQTEQTLSFVAAPPYTHHPEHLLNTPDHNVKLLKSIVVYGANAAGKSNLLVALNRLKRFVLTSARHLPEETFDLIPFLLDDSDKEPTVFEINFYCESIKYNYYLELDATTVYKEYLSYYPKKLKKNIFEREFTEGSYIYKLGSDFRPKRVFEDIGLRTPNNMLFLSKAAQENSSFLKTIYNWFLSDLIEEPSVDTMAKYLFENPNKKSELLSCMHNYDIDMSDIQITERLLSDEIIKRNKADIPLEDQEKLKEALKEQKVYRIKSYHLNKRNQPVAFDFNLESTGTVKLFELARLLINEKENTQCFYIDELSVALHPLLAQQFLKVFHTTNNQLVFTTHDTHLINSSVLRKDQVYFVEKRRDKSSYLYSLLEFPARKDRENWELRYLAGQYGATPFFNRVNIDMKE